MPFLDESCLLHASKKHGVKEANRLCKMASASFLSVLRNRQGVAIVLGQEGFECWKAAGFEVHKDLGARIIAVRLLIEDSKNNQVGLFLVSAYAPVGKEDDSVWERYLGNLN